MHLRVDEYQTIVKLPPILFCLFVVLVSAESKFMMHVFCLFE